MTQIVKRVCKKYVINAAIYKWINTRILVFIASASSGDVGESAQTRQSLHCSFNLVYQSIDVDEGSHQNLDLLASMGVYKAHSHSNV